MGREGKSYPLDQVNTSSFLLLLKLLVEKQEFHWYSFSEELFAQKLCFVCFFLFIQNYTPGHSCRFKIDSMCIQTLSLHLILNQLLFLQKSFKLAQDLMKSTRHSWIHVKCICRASHFSIIPGSQTCVNGSLFWSPEWVLTVLYEQYCRGLHIHSSTDFTGLMPDSISFGIPLHNSCYHSMKREHKKLLKQIKCISPEKQVFCLTFQAGFIGQVLVCAVSCPHTDPLLSSGFVERAWKGPFLHPSRFTSVEGSVALGGKVF